VRAAIILDEGERRIEGGAQLVEERRRWMLLLVLA
jgi:hypothetical protein